MNIARAIGAIFVGGVAGLVLGLYLRRAVVVRPDEPLPATTQEVALHSTHPAPALRKELSVCEKLESDLAVSTGVTRWLHWMEALEHAQPSDFPALAALAESSRALTRIVGSRWAELYPRHCFDTLVSACRNGQTYASRELASILLAEWSKSDPHAVIAALNETKGIGPLDYWRMDASNGIFDVDPELGLRTMCQWRINDFTPNLASAEKWAAGDPLHAAEFVLANNAGSAAESVMNVVGKAWAARDPAAALDFALSSEANLARQLANTVFSQWAGRDLPKSAEWLAARDSAVQARLAPGLVEVWAKEEPESALAWATSNLSGSVLATAMGALVNGAAEKGLPGAAAIVLSLEPSIPRAEAALSLARKWLPRPYDDREKTTPPEFLEWLHALDHQSRTRVLSEVTWQWNDTDPKSLASFLSNVDPEGIPWQSYDQAARSFAQRDPTQALFWAERLPEDQRVAAGAIAFTEWRRAQPDAATSWLNSLPVSDPRRESFLETAIRWMAWDAQAASQLAALAPREQAIARRIVQHMDSFPETRRTDLLKVLTPAETER